MNRENTASPTAISVLGSTYRNDSVSRKVIYFCLLVTTALILVSIALDFIRYFGGDVDPEWTFSINRERSVPEFFGYAESIATVVLLLLCFAKFGTRAFLFWALFFAFVFADDAFSYHEKVGRWLLDALGLPTIPGLRPIDTGEIVAWVIAAIVLLLPLAWSVRVRGPKERTVHVAFGAVFLSLVFFAVIIDMVHEAVTGPMNRVVNWIEDGGEMLSLVAGVSCAILFYRSSQDTDKSIET